MNSQINYRLLDQKVCVLAESIETNILSYVNPLNLEEEKKKFFEHTEKNEQYNPKFKYLPRNPIYSYFTLSPTLKTYKNELKELLDDFGTDSLGIIFEKKILDLFDRIELSRSIGTENFSANSETYYGGIDKETLSYAKEEMQKETKKEEDIIGFEKTAEIIQNSLFEKKIRYTVIKRQSTGSKCAVNLRTKQIMINEDASFSQDAIQRLIAHEIEGHVYRYENGAKQPYLIFARGLSKEAIETEEGIAVWLEQRKGMSIENKLREYSGRIIAINTAQKHDFFETCEEMKKYFEPKEAFTLALRAKRGTFQQDKAGAFFKDVIYLKGFLKVKEFLKERPLKELYYGRYSVYDTPLVLDVDGLREPKYLPKLREKE